VRPDTWSQFMTGVIAVGLIVLIALGYNSWVHTTLTAIVTAYLGQDIGQKKPWKG